jgi:PIN domain nuclease of toxin-antitoxin system
LRLLLDTCTFLWLIAGSDELSDRSRQLFSEPVNEVYLSAVSTWEICVKHALGRLPLPQPPRQFIPQQRDQHGIEPLSLDEESVLHLAQLPHYHRDPFDRMLVCQAVAHGLTLLTPDTDIARYPVPTVW